MSKKTTLYRILLSVLSGIILYISWPPHHLSPLILVGFIPLLMLSDSFLNEKGLMKYSYLAFFTWNILSTWWIWFASPFGAVAALICNALFMALVFQLYHISRKRIKNSWSYFTLPVFWIAFEYLHLNWDLSWPWLTLGNVFATSPELVQWYEYSGVLGGSFWILLMNLIIYRSWKIKKVTHSAIAAGILVLPVLISLAIYSQTKDIGKPVNVTVVQPNIDPYNEKFNGMGAMQQIEKLIGLAESAVTLETDYLIAPETAIPSTIWEGQIPSNDFILRFEEFTSKFPDLKFITGLSYAKYYQTEVQPTATARQFSNNPGYYDAYNTALLIDQSKSYQLHHKSKLVPGVEKMPYPKIFGFLEAFAIDLGGTSGSLAKQERPSVYKAKNGMAAGPIICYESVYGEYVSKYVNDGANLLMIITNDGWWGETDGHRQHLHYARLRCIESRRSIARSANTGISCFINQRGDLSQRTSWWKDDVISATIYANNEITFYTKHGDIAGRTCAYLTAVLIGLLIFIRISR